ncbi:Saposin B-type domain-containing protein [Mycena indigotica]|uniref:Saposin B-type domain-containing protein n=1 Tax=Mycena indigotica TaxID=2126181 RepID=A0A8H6W731_9AGAR|nr:Saposin B-type domain-containing protein [Mycena indigotica]KAF7304053.1 Saposin B-type domain-containing protein [Mycena indigotica]
MPSLDSTAGPILIGAVLSTFLLGVASLQSFHYYRLYSSSGAAKALVGAVWCIEVGHSVAMWHAIYGMFVTFYGQIGHLADPPHSIAFTVLFSAIINLLIQSYFALRIHTLSRSWLIPSICSSLTLARFVFNMFMLVGFWRSSGFVVFQTSLRWLMLCVSVIGPCVDVLTAASLCFYLWKLRETMLEENEFAMVRDTRRMIDRIIVWSLETTSITSAAGVLQLILFITMPDNLAWSAVFLVQPKLFSNSMLAHMHGRKQLKASLDGRGAFTSSYARRIAGHGQLTSQMVFESPPMSMPVTSTAHGQVV